MISLAISRNQQIGGRLSVLNLLKNKLPPVADYQDEIFYELRAASKNLLRKYKVTSVYNIDRQDPYVTLCDETISRPNIDLTCKDKASILNLFGILTSARLNKNMISLCGIQRRQEFANLNSCKVEDIEMLLLGFDLKRSFSLKSLYLPNNKFGPFGSFVLCEALRENVWLKSLSHESNPLTRPLSSSATLQYKNIHFAKVHSFNFRMAISIFLKKFDLNEMPPVRLIFEYLFGYDFVDLRKLQIGRHNPF